MQLTSLLVLIAATLSSVQAITPAVNDACVTPGNIAFAFDQGPSTYTSAILATLGAKRIPATFHVVTSLLSQPDNAALVKQMAAQGHVVGIRSDPLWDNNNSTAMTLGFQQSIKELQAVLPKAQPVYVRVEYPPTDAAVTAARSLGLFVTAHNFDFYDYQNTTAQIIQSWQSTLDSYVAPNKGSFLTIARDQNSQTSDALDSMITYATSKGYVFLTVDRCVGRSDGLTSTNGPASAPTPSNVVDPTTDAPSTQTSAASSTAYSSLAIAGATLFGLLYQFF